MQFVKSNRYLLIYAFFVILMAFGYELFNFTFSLDDELWSFQSGLAFQSGLGKKWIVEGRWGMFLLNSCLHNPSIPVVPFFLTLLFMTAAFFIHFFDWLKEKKSIAFLLFPLFIAAPIAYFAYSFNSLNPGVGIGAFAAALAVRIAARGKIRNLWMGILLAAFSIGVYQVFINVLLFLCTGYMAFDFLFSSQKCRALLKRGLVRFGGLGLGGVGLYYCINRIFLMLTGPNRSTYIQDQIWIFSWKKFQGVIEIVWGCLVGNSDVFGFPLVFSPILTVFCLLVIFYGVFKHNSFICNKICAVICILFLPLAPFVLALSLGIKEQRTFLTLMWLLPFLFYFAWRLSSQAVHAALLGLAVCCGVNFICATNKLAYVNARRYERDKVIAFRILTRLDQLPVGRSKLTPLVIMGEPAMAFDSAETSFIQRSTIGKSFFIGNSDNCLRIVKFLSILGCANYRVASRKEVSHIYDLTRTMPNFPAKGSVALLKGIAVVKFGEFTARQKKQVLPR